MIKVLMIIGAYDLAETRPPAGQLVRDELVENVDPLALFEQNVFSTGYVTLVPKEPNWTCLQFFLTRPHPFLTTPSFTETRITEFS